MVTAIDPRDTVCREEVVYHDDNRQVLNFGPDTLWDEDYGDARVARKLWISRYEELRRQGFERWESSHGDTRVVLHRVTRFGDCKQPCCTIHELRTLYLSRPTFAGFNAYDRLSHAQRRYEDTGRI